MLQQTGLPNDYAAVGDAQRLGAQSPVGVSGLAEAAYRRLMDVAAGLEEAADALFGPTPSAGDNKTSGDQSLRSRLKEINELAERIASVTARITNNL